MDELLCISLPPTRVNTSSIQATIAATAELRR
jgi:hypothetical protein